MEGVVIATEHGETSTPEEGQRIRHVLVTGACGYIGSVLAPLLSKRGYAVEGMDTGFYSSGVLYQDGEDRACVHNRDTRDVTTEELRGYDAVVHLAELSNDPICEFDEKTTYEINHRASVALAEKAKAAGVRRFVYASSCSVYGAAADSEKTEDSTPNPQTAYARCKLLVERDVTAMADKDFVPTFLRNATAFGPSPHMRFDIVLNNLAGLAWTTKCIRMTSDGSPWRPLVHVHDICSAIAATLEAPTEAVDRQIFNVGSDDQNYRVRDIVEAVAEAFPGCSVQTGSNSGDNRSYRVSFGKITRHLPGFRCKYGARDGARQLHKLFTGIGMTPGDFNAPPYTRLRQLRHLLDTKQIDSNFFWKRHDLS